MTTTTPTPGRYAIDVPRSAITFTTKHMFGLGTVAPVTFTVASAEVDGDEIVVEATATVDRYAHGVTKLKGLAARRLELVASVRARRSDGSRPDSPKDPS